MDRFLPRLVVAAMRGGAGKTALCVGMAAAWVRRGKKVIAFKKGPDYIDAAWLSLAAGKACSNLDLFLMGPERVIQSFQRKALPFGLSLIEGNRGLYDGMDAEGHYSTAELAKLLRAPVLLVVDGNKITRTAAALVLGCRQLDQDVDLQGVILNRVAGARHERILRKTIEAVTHLPILGAVPRMEVFPFRERHLGLIPPQEHAWVKKALDELADLAEHFLDLERIWEIGEKALPFAKTVETDNPIPIAAAAGPQPTIGVVRDSVFQFYYPENLEGLRAQGARVKEISALGEGEFPAVDALYIGGGFPETHAEYLAANWRFRRSLKEEIEKGLPVYAECAGLMFLGQSLTVENREYPMVGIFPVTFGMEKRPQGHGYTEMEVERENPFFPVGMTLRGHEFHYSRVLGFPEDEIQFAYRVKRGVGIDGKRDGLCWRNVLASYTHLHGLATPQWAESLIQNARRFRSRREREAQTVGRDG